MSAPKGKSEVHRVIFERAKGGIISETQHRVKRGGGGGGPDYDHEYQREVHPSMAHAKKHLDKSMGDCYSSDSGEE